MTKQQSTHFQPFIRNVRHTSRVELSQAALKKNINFIRKKIGPSTRLSCVVKANAYGHGIPQIVTMLGRCGVNHISVASAYEAEEVLEYRREGTDIMIMGILYDQDIEWAIAHDIEFYIFNYDRLPLVLEKAKKLAKKAKLHI